MTYQTSDFPFQRDLTTIDTSFKAVEVRLLGKRFFRFSRPETSVYIDPLTPYWFCANPELDGLITELADASLFSDSMTSLNDIDQRLMKLSSLRSFLKSVEIPPARPYSGRESGKLQRLSEIWLHVTDRCNLRCSHCLFSETFEKPEQISFADAKKIVTEAIPLGLKVVCLTGGEPLIHPEITEIIKFILKRQDLSIAILTNGLLYGRLSEFSGSMDKSRITLQVSIDGSEYTHDMIRGRGSHRGALESVGKMLEDGFGVSLSMSVNSNNLSAMSNFISTAGKMGVRNVHFMWHFTKGHGKFHSFPSIPELIREFLGVMDLADEKGIRIDNVEAIRSQVFTHIGTRFDLGSAGWETLTVGPDNGIYPTPASVRTGALCGGDWRDGIENVWRNSLVLKEIRSLSMNMIPELSVDPLRFITGGGDVDHCLLNHVSGRHETGLADDPYRPLYNALAIRVIEKEVKSLPLSRDYGLILRMGDIIYNCHNDPDVNFTHSNCLLSLTTNSGEDLIRDFYADRAEQTDKIILNPISLDESVADLVPEFALKRRYGCGSPVTSAALMVGETLVDLGCGSGVELFMASKTLGPGGRAVGVDMTSQMLDLAASANHEVIEKLGFNNCFFLRGMLERLPFPDCFADVVISNCVVNLSGNKRRVFSEIFRILKPGGRFVISDVVSETEPPIEIKTDQKLSGECLGGALRQDYLFSMIRDTGFCNSSIIARFPYREVDRHQFFSMTFKAFKPDSSGLTHVMYKGPFEFLKLDQQPDLIMCKGVVGEVELNTATGENYFLNSGLVRIDPDSGMILDQDSPDACGCCVVEPCDTPTDPITKHTKGCLVCGAPLVYSRASEPLNCSVCGEISDALTKCEKGHFVCDGCHSSDPTAFIQSFCTNAQETDPIDLLEKIRRNSSFPLNGPEHHSLVPAIILTCYRNLGGRVSNQDLFEGIRRGKMVAGGSCASLGICGAAAGVGIAFSIISEATPLTPEKRQLAMKAASAAASTTSLYTAARCCQRECYLSLKQAANVSSRLLGVQLPAAKKLICSQYKRQKECIKDRCELYP